jgi:hypothetical protein
VSTGSAGPKADEIRRLLEEGLSQVSEVTVGIVVMSVDLNPDSDRSWIGDLGMLFYFDDLWTGGIIR